MNTIDINKKWLITGITGQDGSWFADYLIELGYINIYGIIRRSSTFNTQNIDHIFNKLKLYHGDLTDHMNIFNIISEIKPDYIVNFAAQSHVKVSHNLENYTFQVNTLGILNILQSIKSLNLETKCKIYHASTSEMYGNQTDGKYLLNEESPMNPVSIYAISKLAAQQICNLYKNAYNIFIVSSVLFNHESSRRGHTFVTQKIVDYIGKLYNNVKDLKPLELGNLNAKRDWGDATDYIKAIYLMLMQDIPNNYVIATGETHSVREFVELAFKEINIDIIWSGEGINEVGLDSNNNILIKINPKYYRDIDIECLIGDASKARKNLNWKPAISFPNLIKIMVKHAILNNK